MRAWWHDHWADLVGVAGAGAVVVGVAHWTLGGGWVVGGLFALAVAVRAWRGEGR